MLEESYRDVPARPADALSRRELDVLTLAAEGLSNREVAQRLHVSIHAVKFHLASIYRKLGCANRTEAAVLFLTSSAAGLGADAEA